MDGFNPEAVLLFANDVLSSSILNIILVLICVNWIAYSIVWGHHRHPPWLVIVTIFAGLMRGVATLACNRPVAKAVQRQCLLGVPDVTAVGWIVGGVFAVAVYAMRYIRGVDRIIVRRTMSEWIGMTAASVVFATPTLTEYYRDPSTWSSLEPAISAIWITFFCPWLYYINTRVYEYELDKARRETPFI